MNAPPPNPPAQPPPPPVRGAKTVQLAPTFARAWHGIWLFTWQSQLSWRRVPTLLLTLLALPFLVYITVPRPESWKRVQSLPLADRQSQINRVNRRLARQGVALRAEQRGQLWTIYNEEYNNAENAVRAINSPETSMDEQRDLVQGCYDKILDRCKKFLDDRQFEQYETINRDSLRVSLSQVSDSSWNRTAPFYHWLIDFYFFIILPLSCVRGSGGLIRDELQSDTLGFLTTRPISRARLVILKFLSQVTWLQIMALVEGVLLFAAGHLRGTPDLRMLLPLFLAVQFLTVLAFSALGLFLGQITKWYLAVSMLYGLIVELGIGNIPTNINSLSLLRHGKTILAHNATLKNLFQWDTGGVLLPIAALLFGTALFLGLAALLFTFREYHSTTEMQK